MSDEVIHLRVSKDDKPQEREMFGGSYRAGQEAERTEDI